MPVSAADIKLDIYGSTFAVGTEDFYHDRAVRRGIVTAGLAITTSGLAEAVDGVIQNSGEFYPIGALGPHTNLKLPLRHVVATRFGPYKANITLEYGRTRNGRHIAAYQDASDMTTTNEDTEVYRQPRVDGGTIQDGFPHGPFIGEETPLLAEPTIMPLGRRIWSRPLIKIVVPTRLAYNPLGSPSALGQYQMTTNENTVSFGNAIFSPGVLRFDNMDSSWTKSYFGDRFEVVYYFSAMRFGWVAQERRFGAPADESEGYGLSWRTNMDDFVGEPGQHGANSSELPMWYTIEQEQYRRVWGPTTFPVHW